MVRRCGIIVDRTDILLLVFVMGCVVAAAAGGVWGYAAGYGPYIVIVLGALTVFGVLYFGPGDPILWIFSGAMLVFFTMLQSVDVLLGSPIAGAGGLGA